MKTWQVVGRLVRYRPGLYLSSVLLWTLIHGLPLWTGMLVKELFDALSGEAAVHSGVWGLIAWLMVSMITRMGVLVGGFYVDFTFTFTVAALVRKNVLERIFRLPGASSLPDTVGDAISRFRDDCGEIAGFVSWTADLVYKPLLAVVALIVMMRISVSLTLVVLVPLILLLATVNRVKRSLETYRQASRQATGRVTGFISEVFDAVQAVKVAGAETRVVDHMQLLGEVRRKTAVRDRMLSDVLDTLFDNFIHLGTGLILLVAASSMHEGTFTVGDYALFIYYLAWLANITHFLGRLIAYFKQSEVSMERVVLLQGADAVELAEHGNVHLDGTLPEIPFTPKTEGDRLVTLQASGLTFRYPKTGRGIEGIDLKVERGQFTVIAGRVGAGKTTLLRVLLGLLPMEQGDIRWNGERVDDPATFFIPPRSAYTAQVPQLFGETLRENVLMGLPEARVPLQGAVQAAVLERDVQEMEHGLATMVGARGVRLSGGQMQRAAIACMFVRESELLVFDDSSSALDVETERVLWDGVFARRDVTCLAVSHRPSVLERADRIIVLRDGQVEDAGTLAELLERSAEMRRITNRGQK